jgi:ADP-ribose pyrophosphatase YjhB (NUDIX family)
MYTSFPVAVHLFLFRENQVLLLRRANTGYEDGNYSVVAGHLNGEESVTQAAIREAHEEVGIALRPTDLTVVGVMHRVSNDERIDFFLVATTWDGMLTNQEPDKCSELRWCALDALPANTIPYVRTALENFSRGVWFAEFGWPDARS